MDVLRCVKHQPYIEVIRHARSLTNLLMPYGTCCSSSSDGLTCWIHGNAFTMPGLQISADIRK